MAVDENTQFALGNFVSPLTASTTNSLLQDADPALYGAIAFYQAMLQTHLGARWNAEVSRCGLPGLVGKISSATFPFDVSVHLQDMQTQPPWLAVYRTTETADEGDARNWYRVPATWGLQYVLPPLSAAQTAQLGPILRAVSSVLIDRTEMGYDPTYLSGAYVWRDLCGMQETGIKRVTYGYLENPKTNLLFPTIQGELKAIERRGSVPGLSTFTGGDSAIGLDQTNGVAPNFINTSSHS